MTAEVRGVEWSGHRRGGAQQRATLEFKRRENLSSCSGERHLFQLTGFTDVETSFPI